MKVAFIGKAKAGRSMCSMYLHRRHKFKEIGFEDAIKYIMRDLIYPGEPKKAPWDLRMRFYDMFYEVDHEVFINYVKRRMSDPRLTHTDISIDDARYINEVQALADMGFTIIRIVAPEDRRKASIPKTLKHVKPGSMIIQEWFGGHTSPYKADYVLFNGERQATYRALDNIIEDLRSKELTNEV